MAAVAAAAAAAASGVGDIVVGEVGTTGDSGEGLADMVCGEAEWGLPEVLWASAAGGTARATGGSGRGGGRGEGGPRADSAQLVTASGLVAGCAKYGTVLPGNPAAATAGTADVLPAKTAAAASSAGLPGRRALAATRRRAPLPGRPPLPPGGTFVVGAARRGVRTAEEESGAGEVADVGRTGRRERERAVGVPDATAGVGICRGKAAAGVGARADVGDWLAGDGGGCALLLAECGLS